MNKGGYMKRTSGFTIVELLIVIVVIGILAAITMVAFNGVQERARDAQRAQDVKTIVKALEVYYLDVGHYPMSQCGSSCPAGKKINSSWATTSDGTWSILEEALVPKYISALPSDPLASTDDAAGIYGGFNYDYVVPGSWCNATWGQMYLLTYNLEAATTQERNINGCSSGAQPTNYQSSEYAVVK